LALQANINDREYDKFGFESGQTVVYVKDLSVSGSTTPAIIYDTNDIDDAGSGITYIGKENVDGTYLIVKIDESVNPTSFRYGYVGHNPLLVTYATAWASRATLTYVYRGQ
jgi:hypothetical protein